MQINKDTIEDITIYKVISGSKAYGTSTPESDTDVRGIAIVPDKRYYYGFIKNFEQYMDNTNDVQIYDIRKFFALARACNPNIIEILEINNPKLILKETKWSTILKENKHKFLSMKAALTFSGYAFAQLQRIETHRKWLLNPPEHYPMRTEFGLDEKQSMSFEKLQAMNKLINDGQMQDANIIQYIQKENNFRNACMHYKQYEEWKKTRNEKRAELEAKYGYDTKHASHLVRLLRMGKEILTIGKVIVERNDAQELIDIRSGKSSYDEIINYAKQIDAEIKELYKQPEKCNVPYSPNEDELDELCTNIVNQYLNEVKM